MFLSGVLALPNTLPLRICTLTFTVPPLLSHCILFPCPCVPAVESVSAPEMLHGDVVAWMQQVRKAVQSVPEHNGSEYNSLLQQIITVVCWDQSHCAWGPVKALDWWSSLHCGILLPHHSSQLLLSCPSSLVSAWGMLM